MRSRTANRRICAVGGEPIIAYMTDELKTLRSAVSDYTLLDVRRKYNGVLECR